MESSTPFKEQSGFETFAKELIHIALIAAFIVLPIRVFIAQPFIVSGASMEPTFDNGDYLIVDELSYRFRKPERGEVVIFKYPRNPETFFIKRIIGLPGETVTIKDGNVSVRTSQQTEELTFEEPFVVFESNETQTRTLKEDEYFVMGDNRRSSSDSRIWGPLPEENIVGRALVRLFPIAHASLLPGSISPP